MVNWAAMKDAKKGFDKNYLKGPGRYMVRIDSNAFFKYTGRGGVPREQWKITVTVLGVERGDHIPGEVCSVAYMNGGNKPEQMFLGQVKAYIMNVLGCDEAEVNKEANLFRCLDEDGPLNGLVSVVNVTVTTPKDAKKYMKSDDDEPPQFANFSWSPSLTKEEISEGLGNDVKLIKKFFPNGIPDKDAVVEE